MYKTVHKIIFSSWICIYNAKEDEIFQISSNSNVFNDFYLKLK